MRALSAAWNNLTEEQRVAWDAEAHTNRRGGYAARSRQRSGRRLFVKVNSRRLALGQDLLVWPPGPESCKPIPIARLVITNRGGLIAIKLRFSHGSAAGVMVSAWHPLSPGVMVWRKFVRLGLLPAPRGGMSDITRLYFAKYGPPPVGMKVFIRIQQMNDYMGSIAHVTSAIVPAGQSGRAASSSA
jgi:hypothetical protein